MLILGLKGLKVAASSTSVKSVYILAQVRKCSVFLVVDHNFGFGLLQLHVDVNLPTIFFSQFLFILSTVLSVRSTSF